VRPEAIVKIIIPIARPAAVRVTKVENEPMNGAAANGPPEAAKSVEPAQKVAALPPVPLPLPD